MRTPEEIQAAQADLGRRLAARRSAAGWSQRILAARIGFSRSSVGCAETGRSLSSARFWERADDALRAGGGLLRRRNEIAAWSAAASREAWPGDHVPGAAAAAETDAAPRRTADRCPHCGRPLVVETRLAAPASDLVPPPGDPQT